MNEILSLAPQNVWKHFYSLTQIPRPSGHLEKIQAFLLEFGKQVGVESFQDEAGNIIYRKPATPGMEDRKSVILQAHMDMVPQKDKHTQHDFEKDPIPVYVDGEWVKAKGTTLGSDNGMGVAAIMAIMEDKTLKHGPLTALITADEETGMYGAFGLKQGTVEGEILLNLDSEEEGELYIGCAGGEDLTATLEYKEEETDPEDVALKVTLKGLRGGHSGIQIGWGHANANKLMARFMNQVIAYDEACLVSWEGGNMRNAIPREAYAICAVPEDAKHDVRTELNIFTAEVEDELSAVEPDLQLVLESESARAKAIDQDTTGRLLQALYAAPHGVYAMSQDIPGLVETSTNLASVKMKPDHIIRIETSQRSSIISARNDIANTVRAVFRLAGANVTFGEGYPGWKPNPNSAILKVAAESYQRLFGVEAKVKAIHAGLECGLFLDKYPSLDMISFGPTLTGVHSPDERMLIPTVEKFWNHLLDVLVHVPAKQ